MSIDEAKEAKRMRMNRSHAIAEPSFERTRDVKQVRRVKQFITQTTHRHFYQRQISMKIPFILSSIFAWKINFK